LFEVFDTETQSYKKQRLKITREELSLYFVVNGEVCSNPYNVINMPNEKEKVRDVQDFYRYLRGVTIDVYVEFT
jgi:hypothetical protein